MVHTKCFDLQKLNNISPECKVRIGEYLEWEPRLETRMQAMDLISDPVKNKDTLEDRFTKRLQFGTAGLRGQMGAGFNCMNDLTVIEVSQGLALYWLKEFGVLECGQRGVHLGFDGRHHSQRYANAAAAVFLSKGFKVYLSGKVTATPLNPFTVVKYKCVGGIQITASHNPKNDNGYKVYGQNGAQIISPMDIEVSDLICTNLKPWGEALALLNPMTGLLNDVSTVTDLYDSIFKAYMDTITTDLCIRKEESIAADLKVVYTPLHGVGYPFVSEILRRFGFGENIHVVEEQKLPDPEFSTVVFPNPEEKNALDLAIALADRVGSQLIIANDPDADRFASAEKQRDGRWKIFTGDELGILLGSEAYEISLAKGIPKEKMLFVCSTVSSRMIEKMAAVEGTLFEESMTGFKWMMNKALEMRDKQQCVPCFVYEEALGYALDMQIPDKDGISAAAVWIQMAADLYNRKLNITDRLEELRQKYGYFVTNNSYYFCHDTKAIADLFAEFRNGGHYKASIGNYKIKRIRDVTTGYDNGQPDNKCAFPITPSSQMVTLFFENDAVLTLRTSGTEPKLKWYSEISRTDPEEARIELQQVVDATIQYIMQPDKYQLELPSAG